MANRLSAIKMNNDPEHARASREWQENRSKVKSRKQKSLQRSDMLLRAAMTNKESNLRVKQIPRALGKKQRKRQHSQEVVRLQREIEYLTGRIAGLLESRDKADFYNSPAWQKVRYEALKRSNGCCELCGDSKRTGAIIQVDHIKPRSKFPQLELEPSNLQVLCRPCNMGKSNRDEVDWREPALRVVRGG